VAIETHPLFKRLATLEVAKDARERKGWPLGGDGVKYLAYMGVARDPLNPVDGVQIAFDPLLVKGEERGRFEGKQGEGGHEDIWQRNSRLGRAIIWDVGKAGVHQPKERIGGEIFPSFGRNVRHGNPSPVKVWRH
jgi:hypothetical protein